MPRYALKITYDGAPFAGFQWQEGMPTVQGVIESAMHKLGASSERLVAAGRTDAGVHAIGQVVSFDMPKTWSPLRLAEAMNFHMKPNRVAVLAAAEVADDFSARFSAQSRRYLYRILCRRAPQSFGRGTMWQVRHVLDHQAMQEAAKHLIGLHDFTTFRSSACQALSPVKTLDRFDIEAVNGDEGLEIRCHVEARSFMHNQVRSLVGTLERVGVGSWSADDVKTALAAKNRAACGPIAPADGLYFAHVDYGFDLFADGYRDIGI